MSESPVSAPPTEAELNRLMAIVELVERRKRHGYGSGPEWAMADGLRRCIAALRSVRGELEAEKKKAAAYFDLTN